MVTDGMVAPRTTLKQASRLLQGMAVSVAGLLALALAVCAMNGSFDSPPSVDVESGSSTTTTTVVAVPLAPAPTARLVAAASNVKATATKSKLDDDSSDSSDSSSSPTLSSMEREVVELERQIQRHMDKRSKSLDGAAEATSKCDPADDACADAHTQVKWKISQDKYEQAAMNDILRADTTPTNETDTASTKQTSSQEGAALFQQYASKADQISGLKSFSTLDKLTSQLVHLHTVQERQSIQDLKEAEAKLHALRMDERKDSDAKHAARQSEVISSTERHVKEELAKMSGEVPVVDVVPEKSHQDCETECSDIPEKLAPAAMDSTSSVPDTETSYRSDVSAAQSVEAARRQAFLEAEKKLHAKVTARICGIWRVELCGLTA